MNDSKSTRSRFTRSLKSGNMGTGGMGINHPIPPTHSQGFGNTWERVGTSGNECLLDWQPYGPDACGPWWLCTDDAPEPQLVQVSMGPTGVLVIGNALLGLARADQVPDAWWAPSVQIAQKSGFGAATPAAGKFIEADGGAGDSDHEPA